MSQTLRFDQLLEALESLPADAQEEFIEVAQRRLAERGRQRVMEEVRCARREYAAGQGKTTTVDDLMREIES